MNFNMNFKKITAFAAAMVMAAGIFTGFPAVISPLAAAASAETSHKSSGTAPDVTVTYSGVSIDLKWDEVSGADTYVVIFDFPSKTEEASAVLKFKPGDTSASIPLSEFPLSENSPYTYKYTLSVYAYADAEDPSDKPIQLGVSELYFESFDSLEKTDLSGGKAQTQSAGETEKQTDAKAESDKAPAPANFKADKTKDSVTLKWDEADGADMYRVYIYNGKTGKYEKYKDVKSAKCKVEGLQANTKYKFKVVSYRRNDKGKYEKGKSSKAVSVTTKK